LIGLLKIFCWDKRGNTINSEADTGAYGEMPAISGDDSRIILGTTNCDTGVEDTNRAYDYNYNGATWELSETPLDGDAGTQYAGSVVISEQGNRLVVGAVQNSQNGSL
jgi:hypothetical protein